MINNMQIAKYCIPMKSKQSFLFVMNMIDSYHNNKKKTKRTPKKMEKQKRKRERELTLSTYSLARK